MSPIGPHSDPMPGKATPPVTDNGRSAGRSNERGEGGIFDVDLSRLMAAWPTLPEPIKAAMMALVRAGAT